MSAIPQVKMVFNRRKTAAVDKPAAVEIEVSYERERVRLSTGVRVLPHQWKFNHVVKHPDADRLNQQLNELYEAINERISVMIRNDNVNLDHLKVTRKQEVTKQVEFLDWMETRIYRRDIRESTRKQHLIMLSVLRQFGKIQTFADLTTRNIKLWDDWLHDRLNCQTSVFGYHKRLRVYVSEAVQLDLLASNPYAPLKIPRGKSEGIKFLTEEQRKRIEDLELFGPVAKARDMFIFACYTGLAYSDLIKVSRDDIFREGNDLCIVDKRQKTGTQYNIILLPKALEILERYNYNINLMTNQKCNDNLKLIAHMANIPINLTMHVGRHTFATWALSRGVSIETVSKMLAHSDVGTTERYAKVLPAALVSGYHKLR
jgi:site-specific recombinase XerD